VQCLLGLLVERTMTPAAGQAGAGVGVMSPLARLQGRLEGKIQPWHRDHLAVVSSASPLQLRWPITPSPRGCSTASRTDGRPGLGGVEGAGDRR
jgi:hypothetical protein